MPIERRSQSAQIRSILIAVVSLIFVVTLGYAVFRAATGQKTSVTQGTNGGQWNAGPAAPKADRIAADGPILFADPSGAQRLPIYISHTGTKDSTGWYAFEARPPGAADDCFLEWDRTAEELVAPCDDSSYPPNGEGLRQFGATVTKDGDLIIDFTPSDDDGTTTTTAG